MRPGPPRYVRRMVGLFLPGGIVREDVVSSLDEEYRRVRHRRGRRAAVWWYRRQALGVIVRAWALRRGRVDGMSMLGMDVKFAIRAIRRAPAPYLLAILTIALGVGVNAAMFSIVNGVILEPLPYPEVDRLVQVWPEKRWSVDLLTDVRERQESFEVIAGGLGSSVTLLGEGEPEVLAVQAVAAGYFELFGGRPVAGRLFDERDETGANEPAVILSYDYWQSRFGGDRAVVGRALDLGGDGVERRTVVGVMDEGFQGVPSSRVGWIPWVSDPDAPGYRGTYGGTVVARLRPTVGRAQAIDDMRRMIPDLREPHSTQFREIRYSPVDVVPLKESIVKDVRAKLLVLLGAVTAVLLIACTNVANLLLARAASRRREIGLRVALGAGQRRIIRQMMTESVLLGLAGGAVGLGASVWAMPMLRAGLESRLPRAELIELDPSVVLYAVVISGISGLAFGVAPGLRVARQSPASVLGEHGRGSSVSRTQGRTNRVLVVAEVALSLILVVGAGLMLKSLQELARVDVGFRSDHVLSVQFGVPAGRYDEDAARSALFQALLRRIEAVPGVTSVAVVNGTPLQGGWSGIPYMVQGQEVPAGQSVVAGFRLVSPHYFELLEIPLLEGRLLSEADAADTEMVTVVNEAFVARHWPGESPLDRMILDAAGGDLARVVGVVGDTRFGGLDQPPVPAMYFAADQASWSVYNLLVRTDAEPLVYFAAVNDAVHEVEPNMPVREPRTLQQVVADAAGDARLYARLLGGFAALALALGLVGVYGVTSYAVGQRLHEVGMRLALGASRSAILAHTLRQGMAPVALGIALGLVGAFGATRLMVGFLFQVSVTDPLVYAGVAALLASAGALAVLVPATRAMRVDPGTVLRAE